MEASTDADIAQAKTLSAFTKAITYNISDNAAAVSATGAETDLAIKEAVKVSVSNNLKVSEAVEMLDGHSNTGKFTYNLFDDASKLIDAKAGKPSAESKVAYDLATSKTLAPGDVATKAINWWTYRPYSSWYIS